MSDRLGDQIHKSFVSSALAFRSSGNIALSSIMLGIVSSASCFFLLPFAPADVTVMVIVPDHLFSPIWHVGTHDSQVLQRTKGFCLLSVF